MRFLLAAIVLFSTAQLHAETKLETWSPSLFERARQEHKLVLLDLGAVWCHWCHVMEETTYRDLEVSRMLGEHYLVARVDQDGNPDLAARYGDWGWPATIVFAADGTELVKRRGYMPPARMRALLEAIVADPTPGPSVRPEATWREAAPGLLAGAERRTLETAFRNAFDARNAGWGRVHKYVDPDELTYALERGVEGDAQLARMARRTLDAARALADPVWGGVCQYSDSVDWRSPHFEKIMSVQAGSIRAYALAYRIGGDAADLALAKGVAGYLTRFLTSPAGAFYTSQDADLDGARDGKSYYALGDAERVRLGIPRIDRHIYSRENGWAIVALAELFATTGDRAYLEGARRAAEYVVAHRNLAEAGGYTHDDETRGPYLADTLAMGEACLALYSVTAERPWLLRAQASLGFIATRFADAQSGFFASSPPAGAIGVFKRPNRERDENAALARFANRLYQYTGDPAARTVAESAMRYLASPTVVAARPFAPGTLLADLELSREPLHVTVAGKKDDPRAAALWAAVLKGPTGYVRSEWWDRREGPLPRGDVEYPAVESAAAFVCTQSACSAPISEPAKVAQAIARRP